MTANKEQLIGIICTELVHDKLFHKEHLQTHRLVITGQEKDISKTVDKHRNIIPEILTAHALAECSTVACCFGVGKETG